jgi:hypothetical protein
MKVKFSGANVFVGDEGKAFLIKLVKETFLQISMLTDNLPEPQIISSDDQGTPSYELYVNVSNVNTHKDVTKALSNALYSENNKSFFADNRLDYLPVKIDRDMIDGVLCLTCRDNSKRLEENNEPPHEPPSEPGL